MVRLQYRPLTYDEFHSRLVPFAGSLPITSHRLCSPLIGNRREGLHVPILQNRLPKCALHKASGQARVRINGQEHFLGPYDSPESRARYDALLASYLDRQRRPDTGVTASQLVALFWRFANARYRSGQNGRQADHDGAKKAKCTLSRRNNRGSLAMWAVDCVCFWEPISPTLERAKRSRDAGGRVPGHWFFRAK